MSAQEERIQRLEAMARRMRLDAVGLAYRAGRSGAHLGGGLSAIELMAVLYGSVMRLDPKNPLWEERDRFVLSKGHGTLAYYAALYEAGFLSREQLNTFEENGGMLAGHPVRNALLGIECSSGSLGMGISIAVGLALEARLAGRANRVFTLLGDGECNEGSVWEAAMSAVHFKLDQLVVLVDQNSLQSDGPCDEVLQTAPLLEMWSGFGWRAVSVSGHSVAALCEAFDENLGCGRPLVILAQTVKGKGVSFMENNRLWHHGALSAEQYKMAMGELEGAEHARDQ